MKVLGIFRGFPGLGRVVSGVSLLEELRDNYDCEIKAISYLQGNKYLRMKGFCDLQDATSMDYCSVGLLPTNKMGVFIHKTIKEFNPDIILIDGEPLIIQSIKISHPDKKIVVLLNPTDIENPSNDKEAMEYFKALYSMADLAIVHGLHKIDVTPRSGHIISISTILRHEILGIQNTASKNIYCILGGGTVNTGYQFVESSILIANLCIEAAKIIRDYVFHIICSSDNMYEAIIENSLPVNVKIIKDILSPLNYYPEASLVITRSGRNTLSELAYLGIPTISFVTGDQYRMEEQRQNIQSLKLTSILEKDLYISPEELSLTVAGLVKDKRSFQTPFNPGNQEALMAILQIGNSNQQIL